LPDHNAQINDNQENQPEPHIQKFRDYINLHNLADRQAILRFPFSLEGVARDWVDRREFPSFQALSEAFVERFSALHSRPAVLQSLTQRKLQPHESVMQYLTRLHQLAKRINLDDNMTKDFFIQSLPDTLKAPVSLLNIG
jgi:predicted P-loop ATPase